MSALLLKPDAISIVSATNVSASSSKDYVLKDRLGLDTIFTANPVIVIDRGGNTSWDTIAFVQSTISESATIKIEYSNDSSFASGVTTIGPVSVGITSANPNRAKCHVHELASPSTLRYIRVTFASAGAFNLGRIIVGTRIVTSGVNIDAERIFEDMSSEYAYGAYSAYDDQPTLLGWKCGFPWMDETYFRNTWQPFFQTVGLSKCFLFIPQYDDPNAIQSDWCYGRITTKANAIHQGHNMWFMTATMRGIYP